ncbi:hypothetical protein BU15DRAFT_82843 [Melanogaster broomeanus]|nr:hypothetical protein BU15DRAFT_82843 [Melanogaster broomeanus]
MSAMFFVVRYLGYPVAIVQAFGGSSLWFGSNSLTQEMSSCTAIFLFMTWGFAFFILVTDREPYTYYRDNGGMNGSAFAVVMLLRVYAMYNRSRIMLSILILVYIPATAIHLVLTGIVNNPNTHLSVTAMELINTKSCAFAYSDGTYLLTYINVSRTVISVVLCVLAVSQFLRHSWERRRALGRWQTNRYMKLLVQESILYFVVDVLYNVVALILGTSTLLTVGEQIFGGSSTVAPYILAPRLIISVREVHSKIIGEDMDGGFGLQSERFSTSRRDREDDWGTLDGDN